MFITRVFVAQLTLGLVGFLGLLNVQAQSEKLDAAALSMYQEVHHQSVEITKSTYELLQELNSKKGKQGGGFSSQANQEKGMQLLRSYGDTRLAIEAVQGKLKDRQSDPSVKPVWLACEKLHLIVDAGRNHLLDAYQFPDDAIAVGKIIETLGADLSKMQDNKGGMLLKR